MEQFFTHSKTSAKSSDPNLAKSGHTCSYKSFCRIRLLFPQQRTTREHYFVFKMRFKLRDEIEYFMNVHHRWRWWLWWLNGWWEKFVEEAKVGLLLQSSSIENREISSSVINWLRFLEKQWQHRLRRLSCGLGSYTDEGLNSPSVL